MLAVVGTVPDQQFPLTKGKVSLKNDIIRIDGKKVPVNRGTPALMAAAVRACEGLGHGEVFGFLAGDIGLGNGSRKIYEYLTKHLNEFNFHTIVFHYLQPDVDWHNRVMFAICEMKKRPLLIADAGFMYAAKMSGQAPAYDLFTPDAGELAFLADEKAPHPFYTRGFILQEENRIPDLIVRAYKHENAARYLMVKGKKDYVANRQGILGMVDSPVNAAMEAIGGTGDTLTGLTAALVSSKKVLKMTIYEAAILAARVNRLAGHFAAPTPASRITEIIRHIPEALDKILHENTSILCKGQKLTA